MNIQFFEPVSLRGQSNAVRLIKSEVYLLAALKGKDRKNDSYNLNFKNFFAKTKKGWKYIQIGVTDNKEIIFKEGNEFNGYFVSKHNKDVSNKLLVCELIKVLGLRIPTQPNEQVKVHFNFYFDIETNIYFLEKIN